MLLAINRPFKLGDIIMIEGHRGPVRALNIRTTHIRVADGRDIWVPNAMILKGVLTNFTRDGFLRHDFTFGIDTPSDLSAVRQLIINHLMQQPDILTTSPPEVLVEAIGASDVSLRVLFWINVLGSPQENPEEMSERVRSRTIREVKELLLEHEYNLPGLIVEHKIYNRDEPLPVEVRQAG
jgi:small-conductance mechanosensitive channel